MGADPTSMMKAFCNYDRMTRRQEYDRTKDRQRTLGKYMIKKNNLTSSQGELCNCAPAADKSQGGQSRVRLGIGQGSLHPLDHGEDDK